MRFGFQFDLSPEPDLGRPFRCTICHKQPILTTFLPVHTHLPRDHILSADSASLAAHTSLSEGTVGLLEVAWVQHRFSIEVVVKVGVGTSPCFGLG